MAAQKKRAASKAVVKKVAARRKRNTEEAFVPETADDSQTENLFHISSRMTAKQRLLVITRSTERWEDFIKLPVKQLTENELELIIQTEMERDIPRWAVVRRAHSAFGVIRNARERNALEARVRQAIKDANDNG